MIRATATAAGPLTLMWVALEKSPASPRARQKSPLRRAERAVFTHEWTRSAILFAKSPRRTDLVRCSHELHLFCATPKENARVSVTQRLRYP